MKIKKRTDKILYSIGICDALIAFNFLLCTGQLPYHLTNKDSKKYNRKVFQHEGKQLIKPRISTPVKHYMISHHAT